MNSIFILIILWAGGGYSDQTAETRAISAIEFNSEAHCRAAAASLKVTKSERMQVICAPKGPEIKPTAK